MEESGTTGEGEGSPVLMNIQEIDHYDFINAPQYVDFADLDRNDDPNADDFFETHREEDDFLISIENITPTVQLLAEENVLCKNQSQVNQAVSQAGMDDIKVVYYASPSENNKKSAGRKTTSLNSTVGSFHTPSGGEYQDKENLTPSPNYFASSNESKDGNMGKMLSLVVAQPIERKTSVTEGKPQENYDRNYLKPSPLRDSLLSQLEKLTILSSDEEDATVESIEESFYSPTGTPMKTDQSLVESLLKTPGTNKIKSQYARISSLKTNFFEGLSIESPMKLEADLNVEDEAVQAEDEFVANEFPVFGGPFDDNARKQSFIVKQSVGQEMLWNQEDRNHNKSAELDGTVLKPSEASNGESEFPYKDKSISMDNEEYDEADNTLTSSFESYQVGQVEEFMSTVESSIRGKNRRASSCSDITKILESAKQSKIQLSHIPRTGLTIPHSPNGSKCPASKFRSKIKQNAHTTENVDISMSSAKQYAPQKFKSSYMPTVPFKGAIGGVARQPLKASHYVSLAEAISKFQKNTPDRFRTLPKGRIPLKRSSSFDVKREKRPVSPSPVQSPVKVAVSRSRASSVSSQVTTGSIGESKTAQSYQADGKVSGVGTQQKKTTIPRPFNLSSAKPKTIVNEVSDVPEFKFKARPVPSKILQAGPAGVRGRPQAKVTQAMAPHFASDDRIRERHEKKAQSAAHSPTNTLSRPGKTSQSIQAATAGRPSRIPTAGLKALAQATETYKAPTKMKPFSFDQRDLQTLRRKEEKIKQDLENEMKIREFHAHPLPSFSQKLPKKKQIPLTNVEPFHLKSDERGAVYQEVLKQKVNEEEKQLKEMTAFYANPPVVLHKPAFEPEHPARPPLDQLYIKLNTEKRAAQRENFDQYLKQKETEEEEKRREEEARLEEFQQQEELKRRRDIVHKAQPFRHIKQFEIKSSRKALTIPQSPAFNPLPSQRRVTPTKKSDSISLT